MIEFTNPTNTISADDNLQLIVNTNSVLMSNNTYSSISSVENNTGFMETTSVSSLSSYSDDNNLTFNNRLHYYKDNTINSVGFLSDLQYIKDQADSYIDTNYDELDEELSSFENEYSTQVGMIILWDYDQGDIPTDEGWALCDGSTVNGIVTPNLSERFAICASKSTTEGGNVGTRKYSNFKLNEYGGESTHQLTVSEIAPHKHICPWGCYNALGSTTPYGYYTTRVGWGERIATSAGWARYVEYVGGDGAHNNIPPYSRLAYIIFVGTE